MLYAGDFCPYACFYVISFYDASAFQRKHFCKWELWKWVGAQGALLGGLVLACKALKSKQTLVMHTAYVILGLYLISASYLPSSAFIGFVCLTFTGGIAYSIYHALFIAIIQQNLASDMLGRTFSLIFSLSTFPSMLGIVASGYWVEAWGITSVFMISGWVIFLIGVGANFISSIKQLDNYA